MHNHFYPFHSRCLSVHSHLTIHRVFCHGSILHCYVDLKGYIGLTLVTRGLRNHILISPCLIDVYFCINSISSSDSIFGYSLARINLHDDIGGKMMEGKENSAFKVG